MRLATDSLVRSIALSVIIFAVTSTKAQQVTGSTTIDIDPSTGMITATCETDFDANADEYYGAQVECAIRDQNGNLLASGQYDDEYGAGYAQVTLTFQGSPGNMYFATGKHLAFIIFTDEDEGFDDSQYDDYYDIQVNADLVEGGDNYFIIPYSFFGPGPETPMKQDTIKIANTFASVADPLLAGVVRVNFAPTAVDTDDSNYLTYYSEMGSFYLNQVIGNDPYNHKVCYNGNEEIGQITNGDTVGPYTVTRFVINQACFGGTLGNQKVPCGSALNTFPASDTGTQTSTTPNNGKVFNLDIPGIGPVQQGPGIQRVRQQFEIYLTDANGVFRSNKLDYYNAISCTYPLEQTQPAPSTDVPGDNQGAVGTPPLTWNLQ